MNGNGPPVFYGNTGTAGALDYLRGKYGSVDWNNYEYLRQEFWSFVTYPEAGAPVFNFFGFSAGGLITEADTNMETAGMFQSGQHFLVESIRTKIRIADWDLSTWAGADNDTLVSDWLIGFVQAGILRWKINAMDYLTIPMPFQTVPSSGGQLELLSAGNQATTVDSFPTATFQNLKEGEYITEPQVLIENGVTFGFTIEFPTGVVPIIGTDITNDDTNPLKIGVEIAGQWFRPMQ